MGCLFRLVVCVLLRMQGFFFSCAGAFFLFRLHVVLCSSAYGCVFFFFFFCMQVSFVVVCMYVCVFFCMQVCVLFRMHARVFFVHLHVGFCVVPKCVIFRLHARFFFFCRCFLFSFAVVFFSAAAAICVSFAA